MIEISFFPALCVALVLTSLAYLLGVWVGKIVERSRWIRWNNAEWWHHKWGRVIIVGTHPYDGACLIIMRQETTDRDDDEHVYDDCERSDLEPLPNQCWPYLGFTNEAEQRAKSRAWGLENNMEERPPGGGLWYFLGTDDRVPADHWQACWEHAYGDKK